MNITIRALAESRRDLYPACPDHTDKDQVIDFAARKGWDVKTVEKWLGSNLGYKI